MQTANGLTTTTTNAEGIEIEVTAWYSGPHMLRRITDGETVQWETVSTGKVEVVNIAPLGKDFEAGVKWQGSNGGADALDALALAEWLTQAYEAAEEFNKIIAAN